MTTVLSAGLAHSITQDTEYALPACNIRVSADDAVEVSNDKTNWVALTGADSGVGVETSAQFIRCTTGNTIVSIKKL